MRIALCYHGIAKGKNFKNGGLGVGYEQELNLIKNNLIKANPNCKFDIYLHSWSYEFKEEILKNIQPKAYLFERPKIFHRPSKLKLLKENIKRLLGRDYEYKRINNIYSRWYSYYKVCQLVKENESTYDYIIVTRFDMALLKSLDIGQLDKNCFYSGDWKGYTNDNIIVEDPDLVNYDLNELQEVSRGFPYNDEGLQDFFFIASSEYMLNGFSNIFLELPNLIKKYEASNHLIALGKLKEDKKINEHQRVLKFREDYYLTRWL